MSDIIDTIATELKLDRQKVEGAIALLKEEYGVPFIVRYRKEKTGGLNEEQIHAIRDRFRERSELEARRAQAIKTITEAGKLTPELQNKIETAPTRAELEDWYMAFRSRRRTRSSAARAKGLEPLADLIWKQETSSGNVEEIVKPYITAGKPEAAPVEAPKEAAPAEGSSSETPAVKEGEKAEKSDKAEKPESRVVKDMAEALSGARDIIAERVAEHPEIRKIVRDLLVAEGKVTAKAREGVDLAKGKFSGYANFSEPLTKIPAHRILAVMRGASEKQLQVIIEAPKEQTLAKIKEKLIKPEESLLKPELVLAIEEAYDRLLAPSMDNELRLDLKRRADLEAIEVFAKNLRALLLQAPFGPQPVLAIDPGLRNGCKLAVLGADGKLLHNGTIHPHKKAKAEKAEEKKPEEKKPEEPKAEGAAPAEAPAAEKPAETPAPAEPAKSSDVDQDARKQAEETLLKLIKEHNIKAVAIGNGTGSRETDLFIRDVLKNAGITDVIRVVVNESGASLYSASPIAREELPDLDAPTRNAVFIGRRLQNPLAELVKLDPKAIGVGQYQHDVDQALLKQKLDEVVESCVNIVGVDANSASASLLRFVCGLSPALAKNVIDARAAKNGFKTREDLKTIPDLSPKQFEQAAGFLRIKGDNPLDGTAIHPESYAVVEKMAAAAGVPVSGLVGNAEAVSKIKLDEFKSEQTGEPTLKDILEELKAPGRDPRAQFVMPEFNDDVREVGDLNEGMVLNGVVTNLTAFGAFVDVGVHQDGLVHISAITHKFIRDPSGVLSVGQRVKVKVLTVDKDRKRISLSIKALQEQPQRRPARPPRAAASSGAPGDRQGAAGSAQGQRGSRPPRGPRPDRGPRQPRPAATGSATTPPAPAETVGAPAGGRPERGDRRDRRADGGGRDGGRGPRDAGRGPRAPKAPEPGKPDYSKFFVKGKRKEKDRGPRPDSAGASRDEVRQILRKQESGGTTLGDLLKKAGVMTDEGAQ
ncbi:MAG TPA: Tex-like N-terminal domain-containing protein [Planctomycetota bacterium]|nr:Tex-like N-terminal domain-containing protein [Planctomycetota bacterium]